MGYFHALKLRKINKFKSIVFVPPKMLLKRWYRWILLGGSLLSRIIRWSRLGIPLLSGLVRIVFWMCLDKEPRISSFSLLLLTNKGKISILTFNWLNVFNAKETTLDLIALDSITVQSSKRLFTLTQMILKSQEHNGNRNLKEINYYWTVWFYIKQHSITPLLNISEHHSYNSTISLPKIQQAARNHKFASSSIGTPHKIRFYNNLLNMKYLAWLTFGKALILIFG